MNLEAGPFFFGTPEDYARGKAQEFPEEGGPVILASFGFFLRIAAGRKGNQLAEEK
jgi:hypothetical protein